MKITTVLTIVFAGLFAVMAYLYGDQQNRLEETENTLKTCWDMAKAKSVKEQTAGESCENEENNLLNRHKECKVTSMDTEVFKINFDPLATPETTARHRIEIIDGVASKASECMTYFDRWHSCDGTKTIPEEIIVRYETVWQTAMADAMTELRDMEWPEATYDECLGRDRPNTRMGLAVELSFKAPVEIALAAFQKGTREAFVALKSGKHKKCDIRGFICYYIRGGKNTGLTAVEIASLNCNKL